MPEMPVTLIKGDKKDENTDYRDALPVNVSGVMRPILGAKGYMLQQPGITEYGNSVALADGPSQHTLVSFDENDSYDRSGDLSGNANTKLLTFVCRLRISGSAIGFIILRSLTVSTEIQLVISLSPEINIAGENASGDTVLSVTSLTDVSEDVWTTVLISIDMDSGVTLYFDDTAISLGTSVFTPGETLDITNTTWNVLQAQGGASYNCDLAFVWMDNSAAMDFSVESNRRKFIDADGCPVALGNNGETPTGSQPILYLSGTVSEFGTNKGSGGDFTATGSPTDGTFTCP